MAKKKIKRHLATSKKGKKYWRGSGSGVTFKRTGEQGKEYLDRISAMIKGIEYDEASQDLKVTFKNGSSYLYADVSEKEAEKLKNAQSVGKHFNKYIKTKYTYSKL